MHQLFVLQAKVIDLFFRSLKDPYIPAAAFLAGRKEEVSIIHLIFFGLKLIIRII
jgi:hypothetical protein